MKIALDCTQLGASARPIAIRMILPVLAGLSLRTRSLALCLFYLPLPSLPLDARGLAWDLLLLRVRL